MGGTTPQRATLLPPVRPPGGGREQSDDETLKLMNQDGTAPTFLRAPIEFGPCCCNRRIACASESPIVLETSSAARTSPAGCPWGALSGRLVVLAIIEDAVTVPDRCQRQYMHRGNAVTTGRAVIEPRKPIRLSCRSN